MSVSKSKVRFRGEVPYEFLVTTGLGQEDVLSPTLFNLALESVMRQVVAKK